MNILWNSKVALFGIGGVGGYAAEALARAGVGHFALIDSDRVSLSNLNRQIIATHKTVGRYKTDVMRERILEISPEAQVEEHRLFFLPETAKDFDFSGFSYIVDAIDTVTGKIAIIEEARAAGVPVISCMGTGNKLDPSKLKITDLYKTSVCPLARVMRRECRKRQIEKLKVLFSQEEPVKPVGGEERVPGSISFVPSVAGLMMAGEVVRDLIKEEEGRQGTDA